MPARVGIVKSGREACRHPGPCSHDLHALVHGYAISRAEKLEQIQFLFRHASVQTTERYLGCKQKLSQAVNDNLEPELEGT